MQTQRYGLIGYPVKHSFSAVMHNAAFVSCRLDARYELFEVSPAGLDRFMSETVQQNGVRGFNVTIPHKETVVAYLTGDVSPSVRVNQAVNTVRLESDGRLSGVNTDGDGFLRDLLEQGISPAGKRVALLGAGGGARAVASALCGQDIQSLRVYDANADKSAQLRGIIKEFFPRILFDTASSVRDLHVEDVDLLVNATPVGMKDPDPLLIRPETLHRNLFVYDLIYNPVQTKLLKLAQQSGCRWANGLGMLLYQGALAFEFWTGKKAPVDVMKKVLLKEAACLKPS